MTIEKRMIELEEEIESIKEMSHLLATNIKNSELLLERMAKRLSQYEKEKQAGSDESWRVTACFWHNESAKTTGA
ncbi:hypothetical protein [Legionella longbeachae]|uniref:hypothetical protein n=1 Tax=Legionella longbeachae TaxID=450 RepID=UPI0001BEB784|nr:hypothetical protein [Legionella longbeachae]EEZ93817.1 hypothetical protein LLB_2713 [Legionella longbeachae D-4968]